MALFKVLNFSVLIILTVVSCSENTINSDNPPLPGLFVLDSFITNISQQYDSINCSLKYKLVYHFENQHGSIQEFSIIVHDSIGMSMHFNNAYPKRINESGCFDNSIRLSDFNLNLMDSIKFNINISGAFWDYNFETSTFNGFLGGFNWAESRWIKIPK